VSADDKEAPDGGAPDAAAPLARPRPAWRPSAAQVTVAFSVRPRIGATAPTLRVTVRNPNPRAVPVARFDRAACFNQFNLAIRLTRPDGKLAAAKPCTVKDWPAALGELGSGKTLVADLPFAELYDGLTPGVYRLEVDWDPTALERARPGAGCYASSTVLDATTFAIASPLASFRIARAETVALPDGVRLTFEAHGHKIVSAGGPPSPLIVHGALASGGRPAKEFSVNVFTDETRFFSIDDQLFELVDHDYGRWMDLRSYGRLALD
jgi:hypothetical protein